MSVQPARPASFIRRRMTDGAARVAPHRTPPAQLAQLFLHREMRTSIAKLRVMCRDGKGYDHLFCKGRGEGGEVIRRVTALGARLELIITRS